MRVFAFRLYEPSARRVQPARRPSVTTAVGKELGVGLGVGSDGLGRPVTPELLEPGEMLP